MFVVIVVLKISRLASAFICIHGLILMECERSCVAQQLLIRNLLHIISPK